MNDLFDHTGQRIPLGKRIGAGVEGGVYDLPSLGVDRAAKLYHKPPPPRRQAKLRAMVGLGEEELWQATAWPLATLHVSKDGPVCGFVMGKLSGYKPLHMLYNPAERLRFYPGYDWGLLVLVARNLAAAFAAVHRHGHVVGDVGPNLAFFDRNGAVKLVDCDAFQIAAAGTVYPCELAVPHCPPPEWLARPATHGAARSPEHDNFGLASLIFQLLLMGQHPFSGVFLGGELLSLDEAVGQCLYVFGRDAAEREVEPPAHAVSPEILPKPVVRLFERAFGRQGMEQGRPAAWEWVEALDALRGRLRVCGKKHCHTYFAPFGFFSACPWCAQEQYHGQVFFNVGEGAHPPAQARQGVIARASRSWYPYALATALFWFFIPKLIPTYINGTWLCGGTVQIRAGADAQEVFEQACAGTVQVKSGSEITAKREDGRVVVWIYVKTGQGAGWVDKSLVKYRTNPTPTASPEGERPHKS